MFLVPMLRQGGSWVALKPIRLSAHYDDPNWRLESLVAAGEEGIVVSNQTVDWGTGYLQRNMTIYKVIGNEARIVFDAPEYIGVGIPPAGMGPGWKNGYEDVQRSKFEFLRDTNINGLSRIQEMRTESAQKRRYRLSELCVGALASGLQNGGFYAVKALCDPYFLTPILLCAYALLLVVCKPWSRST